MYVFEACGMYRFCVKYVKEHSWATGTGDPPKGIWACNGAYIFGHYNDEDCVLEELFVANSPTIPLQCSHTFAGVEGSRIYYYFRIGARKANVDARNIREIEFRFMPCRCSHCTDGERKGTGTHASLNAPGAFASTCRNTVNMGVRHYTDMRKWGKKVVCREREALERRRGMNNAYREAAPKLAIAAVALLVAEEESASAEEPV